MTTRPSATVRDLRSEARARLKLGLILLSSIILLQLLLTAQISL